TPSSAKPVKSTVGKSGPSAKPPKSGSRKSTSVASVATTTPGSKSKAKATSTATTTSVAPVSRETASASTNQLNPIAQKIGSKPNLSAKLTRMLPVDPMTGATMTLDRASLGFKNQGQFIAALHASQNLGIPFVELKSHMVTVTPGAAGAQP